MTINLVSKHSYMPDGYKPMEYITDLVNYVFSSTVSGKKTSLWTKHIQRKVVANLAKAWRVNMVDEQKPYALAGLNMIKGRLQKARTADADTRAHYADLLMQIRIALSGMPQMSGSSANSRPDGM